MSQPTECSRCGEPFIDTAEQYDASKTNWLCYKCQKKSESALQDAAERLSPREYDIFVEGYVAGLERASVILKGLI